MAVATAEWLDLIEREYIADFIIYGGSAVKFAVGDAEQLAAISRQLVQLSQVHKLAYVAVDAAAIRVHMIQDIFFAVARALDWESMAQFFVESLFTRQRYEWPHPGQAVPIHELAQHNRIDITLVLREFRRWLTAELMRDTEMSQDFRLAMTLLSEHRLGPEDARLGITIPVLQWLRGELRGVGLLKGTGISSKITRHNGRFMLRSLCRWIRLCGRNGICVTLDIRQLAKAGLATAGSAKYSPAAVMDAFEVLRQLIDDGEHVAGLFLAVLADESLIGDDRKRSLNAYQALKMRVWDDVRAEGRDNPLAPLVRIAARPCQPAQGSGPP